MYKIKTHTNLFFILLFIVGGNFKVSMGGKKIQAIKVIVATDFNVIHNIQPQML